MYLSVCVCVYVYVCVIPKCSGSDGVATPSVDWSLVSPLPETFHLQQHSPTPRRGEGGCSGQTSTGMNTFLYCMYVNITYTEGNRFRAVYAHKSTKCSAHRWTLGVRNNCPYNLYAYSAR